MHSSNHAPPLMINSVTRAVGDDHAWETLFASDCPGHIFIVGLLVVSVARRPMPLCATERCTSLVVPRSTPATKRSVTLTTCSRQPAPLPCLPCVCCLIQTGHPQPSCYSGPSVLWVSLPGPTGVPSDAQAEWHRGQSVNPYLLRCCTAAALLSLY